MMRLHVDDPSSNVSTRAAQLPGDPGEACARLQHEARNLVSWHRELPCGLGVQLERWARRRTAHFDEVIALPRYDLSRATRGLAEPARSWITMDIALLLARLAEVANARRLRVSFGAVRTDQCRKFHVDYVRYRLITTYVGPGTEWVPEHAVSRAALERPPHATCDANREIVRDPGAVRRAVPGEVLVMKGALHTSGLGAVHRSPPIEASGQVRVVLVASTVVDG